MAAQVFQRLLVPLNGSQRAEAILAPVVVLAARYDALVTLLHVHDQSAPTRASEERRLVSVADAHQYLTGLRARYDGSATFETHVHLHHGHNVAHGIAAYARSHHTTLIALTTQGTRGLRRRLVGSIAHQVERLTTTGLLIQPTRRRPGSFNCRTLLVPLDGSVDAERALDVSASLALTFHARVCLTRIVPTRRTVRGVDVAIGSLLPRATTELLAQDEVAAGDYLAALQGRLPPMIQVLRDVRRGATAPQLAVASQCLDADLIVIQVPQGATLTHLLDTRSTNILGAIDRPVLVVRSGDDPPRERPAAHRPTSTHTPGWSA